MGHTNLELHATFLFRQIDPHTSGHQKIVVDSRWRSLREVKLKNGKATISMIMSISFFERGEALIECI
jgi:hypothetical protein